MKTIRAVACLVALALLICSDAFGAQGMNSLRLDGPANGNTWPFTNLGTVKSTNFQDSVSGRTILVPTNAPFSNAWPRATSATTSEWSRDGSGLTNLPSGSGSVTITNNTDAVGLVTGGSSSYGIGTNTSGISGSGIPQTPGGAGTNTVITGQTNIADVSGSYLALKSTWTSNNTFAAPFRFSQAWTWRNTLDQAFPDVITKYGYNSLRENLNEPSLYEVFENRWQNIFGQMQSEWYRVYESPTNGLGTNFNTRFMGYTPVFNSTNQTFLTDSLGLSADLIGFFPRGSNTALTTFSMTGSDATMTHAGQIIIDTNSANFGSVTLRGGTISLTKPSSVSGIGTMLIGTDWSTAQGVKPHSFIEDVGANRSIIFKNWTNFDLTIAGTLTTRTGVFSGTLTAATLVGAGGGVTLNAAGFDGNLTTGDDTLQEVAQKVDDLTVSGGSGTFNANQFDANASGTNIKSGVLLTNILVYGPAVGVPVLVVSNAALQVFGGQTNSGTIKAAQFEGPLVGNASTATAATTATTATSVADADKGDITIASGVWAVDANSIALGTDTTGNYAAGDAEAGAALTGDSATAFFSTGTIEAAILGSGSGGSTKFLREDQTWQTVEITGSAVPFTNAVIGYGSLYRTNDISISSNGVIATPRITAPIFAGGISNTAHFIVEWTSNLNVINWTEPAGFFRTNSACTFTASGTPYQGSRFRLTLTNSVATNFLVTLPWNAFSESQNQTVSTITSFGASESAFDFEWDGAIYRVTEVGGPNNTNLVLWSGIKPTITSAAAGDVLADNGVPDGSTRVYTNGPPSAGSAASDTAFASSWNGVTTIPPSKNAVYDWGHIFDTDDDGKVNVLDIGAGIPKTDANGVVSLASAGTDYVAPATTITIAGTANEITSSAGAQDLSANRTWTLSLPSSLNFAAKLVTGAYTNTGITLWTNGVAGTGITNNPNGNMGMSGNLFAGGTVTADQFDTVGIVNADQVIAVSAISGPGGGITLDASGFNGNLTTGDNTVQEVAQKFDDFVAGGGGSTLITQTNFVLNTTYTNGSQAVIVRGTVDATLAAVNGSARMELMVDQTGGITFATLSRAGIDTTVAVTVPGIDYREIAGDLKPGALYYFTNASFGAGNAAALRAGTGQIITISSGTNGTDGVLFPATNILFGAGGVTASNILVIDDRGLVSSNLLGQTSMKGKTVTAGILSGTNADPRIIFAADGTEILGVPGDDFGYKSYFDKLLLRGPDDTSALVLTNGGKIHMTGTLIDGTIDSANTTIKLKGYIVLAAPMSCDQTGAIMQTNDITQPYFGQVRFSNSADQAANYAEYRITVPEDIDTTVAIKCARLKFRLGGADTATHRYVLSMASVADSATYTGSVGNAVNLDFAGDGSGADGDVETVGVATTLTDWAGNVTAGRLWVIRLARDGNASEDASTVNSYSGPLVIEYGISQ